MDLDIRQYLTKATEYKDPGALQSAYSLIKDITAGTSQRGLHIGPELYVLCAEAALQLGCLDISAACLKMYFEEKLPANQFLCRAYLCQGQLKAPSTTGSMEDFEEAAVCFLKAIEISKHEPRYNFMVFNASVLYFQAVRPLLQPYLCHHLVSSLRQVVQSLEEVAHHDHSWRAELMMHLIKCLVDSGKMEEAVGFAKITEEFIKSHTPQFYPSLFTLMVQHKLSENDVLVETSRQSTSLEVIYKMQDLKNRLKTMKNDELNKEDSAKLEEIFHLLVDCTKVATTVKNPSLHIPIPAYPVDRVAFLLELALLALQVKHQKVAAGCMKELKTVGETSAGQRIIMECVTCGINLLKKEAKMSAYCKASVEAQLKEIGKLDKLLQTAVRERDPQAAQAVCATQWSFCLPLLQHNLRKYIKAPLLRMAQVLEDTQSVMQGMRSQIHSELAAMEEEEGRLEAALTHLHKAMLLDNGTQRQRLSSAFHLLQLRKTLYQTPSRNEDKAALLLQQAKEIQPQDKTDSRPCLVAVGLLLAPDDFQMVLDADDTSEISLASGPVAQLCAKAQHHTTCVQRVHRHLTTQGDNSDNAERVKLWATLAKKARKEEVWDVCRAASRFCLLYDDGRWKMSVNDECTCSDKESLAECNRGCTENQININDLLQLLAEIRFIAAEATVQKLLTEGVKLNSPAVPPRERGVCVSEVNQHWIIYRDWIQTLSAHATSNFLRAAELGVEINEPWVVANAAIYLWNYNSHLLAAGEYQHLVPTFQGLVEMLQKIEFTRNRALVVLLCDVVARGLIQPLCNTDYIEPSPQADKGKNRAEKGMEKAANSHGSFLDPAPLQDVHKALQLSEYALHLSGCNNTGEKISIAVRKQAVATWVQIKRLLKQQIGSEIDIKHKSEDEDVSAMTRVLVAAEMLQCNKNPRHMEFSAPSLSTLLSMASECSWTDAVVELQVWCQLASFCYDVNDHSLVLCCTKNALQLEGAATKTLNIMPCALYSLSAVNEMLSSAACLRGLSLAHESRGDLHKYREALKMLLFGVSNAEKADNPALCITAAKHYWNTCLPLTQIPVERWQFQKPLEKILTALVHTNCSHTSKQGKAKRFLTLEAASPVRPKDGSQDEDLSLRADIYSFLLQLHVELKDWKSALQLLDKAISDVSCTRRRIPLQKQRILVKVQLGENILMDMQKLRGEDEWCCSSMWHQAALCATNKSKQLTYYQESITSAMCPKKVSLLMEFGAWLYCHNFPKADAHHQLQWAIDILLNVEPEQAEEPGDNSKGKDLSSGKCELLVGVQVFSWIHNLSNLKEVWRLDYLIQAHTLVAVMTDKTSPEYQLYLVRAYTFVLQIWKESMAVASQISSDMAKCQPPQPPQSAGSKKDQDKGKNKKTKDHTPAEERPKSITLDQTLPSAVKEWACYMCPDQVRQIFRANSNPHCINRQSISKQTQSLFYLNRLENELRLLSLDHLTLPVLHLAETIAHDLMDDEGLSDLYRLRIVRTCWQLGVEANFAYQEKLVILSSIQKQMQMRCQNIITSSQGRSDIHKQVILQKTGMDNSAWLRKEGMDMRVQDIWLDKAEVCLSMGLYQPTRQLLAEAHLISVELGDLKAVARCLLKCAILACEEQNYAQALILLDKSLALGGNKEFWYHFTLTKVRAVLGQRHRDAQAKAELIIKEGCEALKLNLEQQAIQAPELTFMIISLEMRGAMECISFITGSECGGAPSTEALQRLTSSCDKLRDCAITFTKLSYNEQAAEAHAECAHTLRFLSSHAADPASKQRFLLNGLSQMQLAVMLQEHVAQRIQDLLYPQEESHQQLLPAIRKLLRLRLALAEFCLAMLEEHCAEEKSQAVARMWKTSVMIALEDFTRCTPEPDSLEQEWVSVGSTLGQVALSQLAAVRSYKLVNMETRARCLTLMGTYLRLQAVHEGPVQMCFLWGRNKQVSHSEPKPIFIKEGDSEKDGESSRMTSAKRAELQQKRCKVQQLLTQASKALAEATSLCLQHNLPRSILADASLSMLECHGQSNPAVAGQYLALFQSCCTVSMIVEVLSSACANTSVSQFSALLSFHRKLLLAQEERPSSMLRGVEDSLNSLSKAFSHLTISPNHLNMLAELPPNLKILLLQHNKDGSQLYGAFYETTKESESPKGKTGILTCSSVAKVSVCPQALGALRKKTQAFGQETRHTLLKEGFWQSTDSRLEVTAEHQETAAEKTLEHHFREIVQDMEEYLNPLLEQFDFSCLRLETLSAPEMTRIKEKEDKANSAKEEQGTFLVLLADQMLLELPLEALSILQEKGLTSVSRDFSLQLLHSRLNKEEPQIVEKDNKKETKGARGTKEKGDQSRAIKVVPANRTLPSNTFPIDSKNFKYIIDPNQKGNIEGTCPFTRIEEILESHNQQFTHPFVRNKQKPSLPEMEQLLCRCSAFIYLGMQRFTEDVPLSKLAALNLCECRMALLFDRIQNSATLLRQSSLHLHKSTGKLALEETLETALLLSVVGVGCVVLNHWHSSLKQNTHNVATILDNMLRSSQTSGQSVYALRKGTSKVTGQENQSHDQTLLADFEEDHVQHKMTHSLFNCVLYGLPNLIFT
ncbi:cilia- and flagella-associated protein 46 isoform X3 [Betta splendens]|uniref:Cilia- and flagella-associated protein 46 isoform X3 n=1 Tax=Betta splendens TaxID=158456 RepID=A0A6P7KKH3_BETSP|nr:cilia- and flagella-associated protein 46 isoform X3 [Betta splendens]